MHASVGFPPHPLATHVLTWTRISEDVYTNASTQSCTCKMQGLFYLTFNCNSFRTHLFIILPKQVCFLPCRHLRSPRWKKWLCLLFRGSSALGALSCLRGSRKTIRYTDNKDLHNLQLFAFSCLSKTYGGGKSQTLLRSLTRGELSLIKLLKFFLSRAYVTLFSF